MLKLTLDIILPAAVTVAIAYCMIQMGMVIITQGDEMPLYAPAAISAFAG